jgi:hypothetical protein
MTQPPDDGWRLVLEPTAMHYWCVCGTTWSSPWAAIKGDMVCPACMREPNKVRIEQETHSSSVLPEPSAPDKPLKLVD